MLDNELDNPFNITKATDFSNSQIEEFWVDFYSKEGNNIGHYLNVKDLTAKYIIGSKGCGKTHLLRYYSYQIQKVRHKQDVQAVIENDSYVGLYNELGAMNSSRMYGYSIETDKWDAVFGYYLELFVGINLIDTIAEIFQQLNLYKYETIFIESIKDIIFFERDRDIENTILGLRTYINDLKKDVDSITRNAAITRQIDPAKFSIKISPGDLFFKLPNILVKKVPELAKLKFIFILDELEKLKEYQKVYVNTLVWDKKDNPSTFWIGARTFGYTTRETKTGEKLTNGSEFKEIRLDDLMREDEDRYKKFAINLCAKRLKQSEILKNLTGDLLHDRKEIDSYYAPFNEADIVNSIALQGKKKSDLYHRRKFKSKIQEALKKNYLTGAKAGEVNSIFDKYIKTDNLLLEKYKIYHFYRSWNKTKDINSILDSVAIETEYYIQGNEDGQLRKYEEKFKLDFLAQLIFESNQKIYQHIGLDNFVKVSNNNPRALLVLLKEIFERASLTNETPFQSKGSISIETQSIGIYYASLWFYQESEAYGENGKILYKCINALAELLQGIRYSDKPSETTPSSFSFKYEKISAEAMAFIELAVLHRMLIPIDGRSDKNSERIDRAYQLNRTLSPYFNLPISRRGIVPLSPNLVESIFNPARHYEFQTLFNEYIDRMNAPFSASNESKNLFND